MTESTPANWRRAIRPLICWSIMVLLMFAYRTHERLSANTRISFDPTLAGKSVTYETQATIDGMSATIGQRIPIGWHTLTITHNKTKPYSTNLFVWYGEHDLGQLELERAMGTLVVNVSPVAQRLTIIGTEFSVTLTNTSGITSSVPTDNYVIEASYKYWNRKDDVTVFAGQSSVQSFAPKLGSIHIEASHQDVIYKLFTPDRQLLDAGKLPATLHELPEGKYHLISTRKDDERGTEVEIKAGVTNAAHVAFIYGVAVVESDPSGASVISDGRSLGVTPLTISELKPGAWEFTLRLADYESATSSLTVVANETNAFSTNLVSRFYTQAMTQARRFFENKDYALAAEMSAEALKHKPGDDEAVRLQRDAIGHAHLARAEMLGRQGDFVAAIKAANAAVESLQESIYAKTLLADLTKREQERIEAEKKRQVELGEQKRKQEEAEQAANRRQQNINRLNTRFYELNRTYNNAGAFARHELVATNAANSAATAINSALVGKQPTFEIVKYEWPQADTFTIQARQRIGVGHRECLIVGAQVQSGEMHVLYKVFEYENPPDLNMLGGLLNISGSIKITSQDPTVEKKKTERFQLRIKEGVELVKGRIQAIVQEDSK